MNTSNTSAPWVPYKIPPCPTPEDGQIYALSFSDAAVPTKNPSQFLEWKEVGFPEGSNLGDILYWDPAGGGAWAVLSAPSGSGLKVLTATGGNLAWNDTQDC